VIWSFEAEWPDPEVRQQRPWLTVVSWRYDSTANNGMPMDDERAKMLDLELALDPLEDCTNSFQAYRRTGNGLKEFVYYVGDQGEFMARFNDLLAGHPSYPLEVHFFEDRTWSDFEKLLADFRGAPERSSDSDTSTR
jgi:Family of unknown function (DUF695)